MNEEIVNIVDFSSEGIIVDCVNEQDSDVIGNGMLGTFNRDGRYLFSQAISQELIDMPKTISSVEFVEETSTKVIFAYCLLPIVGRVDFKLTISHEEAVLFLVESFVNNLTGKAMLIDRFVDAIPLGGGENLSDEIVFENYHFYNEDDDSAKEIVFDMEDILFRKMYLSSLFAQTDSLDSFDYEEESNKIIEFLKTCGLFGMEILTAFATEMEENKEIYSITSSKLYHKKVNAILHQAIVKTCTEEKLEKEQNRQIFAKIKDIQNETHEKQLKKIKESIDTNRLFKLARDTETHYIFEDKEKLKEDAKSFQTAFLPASKADKSQTKNLQPMAKAKLSSTADKKQEKRHKLEKPILKQNKIIETKQEVKVGTKEEKIRQIVDKTKVTTAKVSPAKSATASKKLSPKKKTAKKTAKKSKKVSKAKSKSAKKVKAPSKVTKKDLSSKKNKAKDNKSKEKGAKKDKEKKEEKKKEKTVFEKFLESERRRRLFMDASQPSKVNNIITGITKFSSSSIKPAQATTAPTKSTVETPPALKVDTKKPVKEPPSIEVDSRKAEVDEGAFSIVGNKKDNILNLEDNRS